MRTRWEFVIDVIFAGVALLILKYTWEWYIGV